MKKYKLIKKYPSLPEYVEVGEEFTYYEDSNCYLRKGCSFGVYKTEVENYPEFWEEVKER